MKKFNNFYVPLIAPLILKVWSIKLIHLNNSKIKPPPHIPNPPFRICIVLLLNGCVSSKAYDKRDDL